MNDLIFLHSNHDPACRGQVNKQFAGYHTLQFGVTGGVELFYNAQRHLLTEAAWFWTAYPGPHIRFHVAPGQTTWNHRYVAFQGPRVAHWVTGGIWPDAPQSVPTGEEYAVRFDTLLTLVRRGDRWSTARAVNLLEAFLLELAEDRAKRAAAPDAGAESWLDSVLLELAREKPDTEPDYPALADLCGMSLSSLRRRFRAATGTPLHEWTMQARIVRARALLGETDTPIKAIAEQLGYRDVYFFTRQFRQRVGVPPAAFRRSRQG